MSPAHGKIVEAATVSFVAVEGESGDWAMYSGPAHMDDATIANWGIKLEKFKAMVISEYLFDRDEYHRRWFNMEYRE